MGDPKGFLTKKRQTAGYRPKAERLKDFNEVELRLSVQDVSVQGSRCMDCGVPFCHYACPVGNVIPDWNDLIFRGQWEKALEVLHSRNNFPEFTGRVCPALCESACVLGINDDPVTVRENEIAIVERGFRQGVIRPFPVSVKTGKRVAVIGSGPAGMAAAQQLTRAGHGVVLFEADDKAGGLLRYGIPDFKLEKEIIDRRLDLMRREGLKIETNVCVGRDLSSREIVRKFDAVCLAIGSREPRDLKVEGRDLRGIHFAMDYLVQSNRRVGGYPLAGGEDINAKGKRVVVIGGGDTGSDCVGVANRQGAAGVTQIELLAQPPVCRTKDMPWPSHPALLKTSSSHQEGCRRYWSVLTKAFSGSGGRVKKVHAVKVEFMEKQGRSMMREIQDSAFEMDADLVILAMGFIHPVQTGLVEDLGLRLGAKGQIHIDDHFLTSRQKVFAAGDASRGASLVIWAIDEGRRCAREIDRYLMGSTDLL